VASRAEEVGTRLTQLILSNHFHFPLSLTFHTFLPTSTVALLHPYILDFIFVVLY